MIPRLILIFVFLMLVVLAVKKGFSPDGQIIETVPGYPAPVALEKFQPTSDEEFLKSLPSAADYAYSFTAQEEKTAAIIEKKGVSKKKFRLARRSVATKAKTKKR